MKPVSFEDRVAEVARQTVVEVMSDPLSWPAGMLQALPAHLEVNPPTLPVTQITGFSQFTATASYTADSVAGAAGSVFGTTANPVLSGLPNGNYVVLFGIQASVSNQCVRMGIGINGATPVAPYALGSSQDAVNVHGMSVASAFLTPLSNGVNTLQAYYDTNSFASGSGTDRFLIALKYSNL